MKKRYYILAAILIGYGTYLFARFQDKKTEGFYVERIASIFPDNPKWDVAVSSEQSKAVEPALKQSYTYLAHGFQCYAFASQDGKYILKFIRQQRLQPMPLFQWLPDIWPFKDIKAEKEQFGLRRANYLFTSLKVAFEDVPEETGLLLVHLNSTKGLYPAVTLYDKAGQKHTVMLDSHQFVLQKRALPIKQTLASLMQEGKVDEAKARIDQIFTLLATCAKKGIADMDMQLIRKNNLGFLPDRAIYVDTGKITRKESMKTPERFKKDLERLIPLREWLQENYPELAEHFDQRMQQEQ